MKTLKETRRLVEQAQGAESVARHKADGLSKEVARLQLMVNSRDEGLKGRDAALEKERSNRLKAEESLRMVIQELTSTRQEAGTAQTRVEMLEAECARRPQSNPVGQGVGIAEMVLDATGIIFNGLFECGRQRSYLDRTWRTPLHDTVR